MLKTFIAATTVALLMATSAFAADINGAGATFPAPVYSKWAEAYRAQTKDTVNYQAVGSGAGVKQIEVGTVDFGATDKPQTAKYQTDKGMVQFPTVIGGVVPIINLPGFKAGEVRLNAQVLSEIYLGNIKKWNDPRIVAINPAIGWKLPGFPITVVHRSDGSGTSFIFTSYLASNSPTWKSSVGANDAVAWPTGIGGKGNDGVSAFVRQTPGSIGYVEYAFAKQNKATYTQLQNKDGKFVNPTAAAFSAAAAKADWAKAPGYYLLLINQPGANSWPITGATFILVDRVQDNAAKGAATIKFFDWAYKNGDAAAVQLDYIPLPASLKSQVRKTWSTVVDTRGNSVYK